MSSAFPASLARGLARLIAPPVCLLCGGAGQDAETCWGLDLCAHCQAACPRAEGGLAPFPEAFCVFRYEEPVDQLIVRLKFQREVAAARVLGTLLARALREARWPLPQCLVPMPLHPARHRERGFCQTSLIAAHAARRLRSAAGARLPLAPGLLQRVRAGDAQSGLSATARSRNLHGAFRCPALRVPRHVALLDDVLTTGSTAAHAITALRLAGVEKVDLWCCARTLRRDGN
jgi:ComF family protein